MANEGWNHGGIAVASIPSRAVRPNTQGANDSVEGIVDNAENLLGDHIP